MAKTKLGGFDPLDVHIGKRIRDTRKERHMTLETLSRRIGVISEQQLKKYESGANRVSASMMFRIASVLDVHPGHFFSGLVDPKTRKTLPAVSSTSTSLLRKLDGMDAELLEIVEFLASRVKRMRGNDE